MKLRVIAMMAALLFGAQAAAASELRIIDSSGLNRAIRMGVIEAKVTLELAGPAEALSQTKLVNIDGLLPDRTGRVLDSKKVVFEQIAAGTWQVHSSAKVISVVISENR